MGDPLRKAQAKNFKKARDKAIEDAKQQSLVQRPTRTTVAVTIKPLKGQTLVPNETLILLDNGSNSLMAVRGHENVGFVDGEAADVAKGGMAGAGSPHGVQVTILNVADLSGVAQAQIMPK